MSLAPTLFLSARTHLGQHVQVVLDQAGGEVRVSVDHRVVAIAGLTTGSLRWTCADAPLDADALERMVQSVADLWRVVAGEQIPLERTST